MNFNPKMVLPLPVGLLLSACASYSPWLDQPGDTQFGEANRQTMMAQVVNPDPYYTEPMETSGEHAANAIERYRNDAVTEPEAPSTTTGATGGSGGGGGGGS